MRSILLIVGLFSQMSFAETGFPLNRLSFSTLEIFAAAQSIVESSSPHSNCGGLLTNLPHPSHLASRLAQEMVVGRLLGRDHSQRAATPFARPNPATWLTFEEKVLLDHAVSIEIVTALSRSHHSEVFSFFRWVLSLNRQELKEVESRERKLKNSIEEQVRWIELNPRRIPEEYTSEHNHYIEESRIAVQLYYDLAGALSLQRDDPLKILPGKPVTAFTDPGKNLYFDLTKLIESFMADYLQERGQDFPFVEFFYYQNMPGRSTNFYPPLFAWSLSAIQGKIQRP